MSPLVRLSLIVRRTLRIGLTVAGALALASLVVYDAAAPIASLEAALLGAVLASLLGRSLVRRLRAVDATYLAEAELGCLAVTAAFYLVVRADRSFGGDAYPTVFVCLAVVSAFARPAAALTALALAIGLEVAIRRFAYPDSSRELSLANIAFMVVFTGLNAAVLRTEVTRLRSIASQKLRSELDKMRDDARSYRLLGAPSTEQRSVRHEDEDRLTRSGVEEIHQSVLFALRLVRETMGLHTAMLLWKSDAGTHLRISELSTDAAEIVEGPFLAGDGGAEDAVARAAPVSLYDLKESYKLPYYAGPCPVGAVVVVPVFEHGVLRGLFVADRMGDRPFLPREEAILEEASRYAVRAIHSALTSIVRRQGQIQVAAIPFQQRLQVLHAGIHVLLRVVRVVHSKAHRR